MKRNSLRTTVVPGKVVVWELVGSAARILRVQLTAAAFTAYRLAPCAMRLPVC